MIQRAAENILPLPGGDLHRLMRFAKRAASYISFIVTIPLLVAACGAAPTAQPGANAATSATETMATATATATSAPAPTATLPHRHPLLRSRHWQARYYV
jgi:hypothetical protein